MLRGASRAALVMAAALAVCAACQSSVTIPGGSAPTPTPPTPTPPPPTPTPLLVSCTLAVPGAANVFVSALGNDAASGLSSSTPVRTIHRGLTLASNMAAFAVVAVAGGVYDESAASLFVPSTVTVSGSWDDGFTARDLVSTATEIDGAPIALIASAGSGPVTLDGLIIRSASAQGDGKSSIGVRAAGASGVNVSFHCVSVQSGDGANGASGLDGAPGASATAATAGGNGTTVAGAQGLGGVCTGFPATRGGKGGKSGPPSGNGGDGFAGAAPNGGSLGSAGVAANGGDGGPGTAGSAGSPGAASDPGGISSQAGWHADDVTSRGADGVGGGGGGGGGGGSGSGSDATGFGGAGGGGGGGGCGGAGGGSGHGGGASFGVYATDVTLVLSSAAFRSATGGAGGNGALGGVGGSPSAGQPGGTGASGAHKGGKGGNGASAGGGGPGAGGAGGPSVAVWFHGGTIFPAGSSQFVWGSGGAAGLGSAPAPDGVPGVLGSLVGP